MKYAAHFFESDGWCDEKSFPMHVSLICDDDARRFLASADGCSVGLAEYARSLFGIDVPTYTERAIRKRDELLLCHVSYHGRYVRPSDRVNRGVRTWLLVVPGVPQ